MAIQDQNFKYSGTLIGLIIVIYFTTMFYYGYKEISIESEFCKTHNFKDATLSSTYGEFRCYDENTIITKDEYGLGTYTNTTKRYSGYLHYHNGAIIE